MKFPTGGDKHTLLARDPFEIDHSNGGFGEIPKPTVQSGWEKMEVSKNVHAIVGTFI